MNLYNIKKVRNPIEGWDSVLFLGQVSPRSETQPEPPGNLRNFPRHRHFWIGSAQESPANSGETKRRSEKHLPTV